MPKELIVEWLETTRYSMAVEVPDDFDPNDYIALPGTELEAAICEKGYDHATVVSVEDRDLIRITDNADDGETWEY